MKKLLQKVLHKDNAQAFGFLAAMLVFGVIAASPVAAQTIPVGQPARFGAIIAWAFRLVYAACAVVGAFYIIKAVKMFSDSEKGAGVKAIGGIAMMIVGSFVGMAVEISQGNLPDLGLGDLMQ